MDGEPVLDGKGRMALAGVSCCCVPLEFRGERHEGVLQAPQEPEHGRRRGLMLHHYETHEVQAEVARDGGRLHRRQKPAQVSIATGLGGPIDAALAG